MPDDPTAGPVPAPESPAPGGPDERDGLEPEPKTYSREYVAQLRREAASARTKLKDYETAQSAAEAAAKAEQGRFKELYEAAQADLAAERLERIREKVAAKYALPPLLAGRLTGTTEAELDADAAALAAALPKPAAPSGGAPTTPARPGKAPSAEDDANAYYERTRGKSSTGAIRL